MKGYTHRESKVLLAGVRQVNMSLAIKHLARKQLKVSLLLLLLLLLLVLLLTGDSAVSLVSPPKTRAQVEEESLIGKDLYRLSHHDYGVGEIVSQ